MFLNVKIMLQQLTLYLIAIIISEDDARCNEEKIASCNSYNKICRDVNGTAQCVCRGGFTGLFCTTVLREYYIEILYCYVGFKYY